MTYQQAISYIHAAHQNPGHSNLEPTKALLAALGNPQNAYRCLHVAGTNGKGSFCAMSDAILRAAGYRTGLFTSPFIREFEERFRVDGKLIECEELAEITSLVKEKAEALSLLPFEFELVTVIGFEYFRRHKVDIVVLEVGMGGRLDPTNVISDPLLSVITGIDFDHTELLGNTIQAIAAEKSGIIKSGYPSLYGGNDSSACGMIASIASGRRSPFYTVDCSRIKLQELSLDGTTFDFGDLKSLTMPLLGAYQPQNAATVLTAMEILTERHGLRIDENAIRKGLAEVRWPARFELLRAAQPTVIFDGAHNPQGVQSAVKSIRNYFPEQQVHILSAVMGDKNFDEMIEALKPITKTAYTVAQNMPRALPSADYAAHFHAHGIPANAYPSICEGLSAALADSAREETPLICLGSLYFYRELTDALSELT